MKRRRPLPTYFVVKLDGNRMKVGVLPGEYSIRGYSDGLNYLYRSDERSVQVGPDVSRALRFHSAEVAIRYISRNEMSRGVRLNALIERIQAKNGREKK